MMVRFGAVICSCWWVGVGCPAFVEEREVQVWFWFGRRRGRFRSVVDYWCCLILVLVDFWCGFDNF